MNDMLWFGGHWWLFPGAWIGEYSRFQWRDNRVYLLEPDGSIVEGIEFVGEVELD
jgi:hypothetical protein